jgi:thiosulfate/3-mercaptopyruvate sulfurtransferase
MSSPLDNATASGGRSPFITATVLAEQLASPHPPAVLDASMVLHPAQFDGDYRRDSGRPRWVAGHIPGSQWVDVATEFSDTSARLHYTHPTPQHLADELARLGIAEGRGVVVYDSTGNLFAARLWYLLRWIGVDVRVLDGGYAAWVESGGIVETGETPPPAPLPTWHAEAVRPAWITKDELLQRAADDDRALVCGLPAGSFTGADPSRYSRRGRIPGSVNVSSRDLFTQRGTVKSRVELILAYDGAGVDVSAESPEILLYCGGGISAAANALTLAEISDVDVRIYDGSLEEWSSDPSLPLDVGAPH